MGRAAIFVIAMVIGLAAVMMQQRYQGQEAALVTLVMEDGREVIIRSTNGQQGMMQIALTRLEAGDEDSREEAIALLRILADRGYDPAIETLAVETETEQLRKLRELVEDLERLGQL